VCALAFLFSLGCRRWRLISLCALHNPFMVPPQLRFREGVGQGASLLFFSDPVSPVGTSETRKPSSASRGLCFSAALRVPSNEF